MRSKYRITTLTNGGRVRYDVERRDMFVRGTTSMRYFDTIEEAEAHAHEHAARKKGPVVVKELGKLP